MANRAREDTQRERADARERRRATKSQPFETLEDAVDGGGNGVGPAAAAKDAARTAAAAALAGGLAGAAKALLERRRRGDGEDNEEPERHEEREQREAPRVAGRTEERDEPAAEGRERDDAGDQDYGADDHDFDGDAADADLFRAEGTARPHPLAAGRDDASPAPDRDEPDRAGSSSEVADVVEQARGYVASLLGKEAESVAGISRAKGSWTVTVEVVDVHRIPDSTDVLSSYDVVVDDDGGLIRLERRARYRRAQVEEGR